MRTFIRIVMVVAVIAIIFVFAAFISKNSDPVTIDFLSYKTREIPKYLVIIGAFVAGAIVSGILLLGEVVKQSLTVRKLKKARMAPGPVLLDQSPQKSSIK